MILHNTLFKGRRYFALVSLDANPNWEEREETRPILPSLRSLIFTAFLVVVGTLAIGILIAGYLIDVFSIGLALSLAILYVRLRPLLKLGFRPKTVIENARDSASSRRRLLMLQVLAAVIPLLLIYIIPFLFWLIMVYLLIICWPLANMELFVVLKVISKTKNVEFYRVIKYRRIVDEEFVVAIGYSVKRID